MVTAAGDSPADPTRPPSPGRSAVSDPSVPTPAGMVRATVINVLGRSAGVGTSPTTSSQTSTSISPTR
jgi:hypothetical protein